MRVAYVCADPGVPVFGCKGCSIHVQEFTRALVRSGANVTLFARRTDGPIPEGLEGVHVYRLPAELTLHPLLKSDHSLREQSSLATNEGLRMALESEGPFDLVYERYSLWSYAGMEYARDHKVPGLLEVNAPLIEEQSKYRVLVHDDAAEEVASRTFGAATALVAVSDEVGGYLESRGVEPGRIAVVPNGVDPDRFSPAEKLVSDKFIVGFVGTLKPWHGLDKLIEAFAMLHKKIADSRLVIIGDGKERDRLVKDADRRALSHVVDFVGAVPPSEIPEWLARMDVAVAPYPDLQGFYFSPLKVYEYMAAGLPVVASDIGQIKKLVDDGFNGLLCKPGDPVSLASAMERLYRESGLRDALGANARSTVREKYTWADVVKRVLTLAGLEVESPKSSTCGIKGIKTVKGNINQWQQKRV